MKLNPLEKFLGSGFYAGYLPKVPGTWGSLFAMIIILIPGMENPSIMIFLISFFIVIGVPVATKFESVYGKDPKECTIDEFVGTWIALLFVPKKIWWFLLAFIIWRVLDIVKPYPARKLESIKGGWGIMLDDIAAGIYSFISVQLIIYAFNMFTK